MTHPNAGGASHPWPGCRAPIAMLLAVSLALAACGDREAADDRSASPVEAGPSASVARGDPLVEFGLTLPKVNALYRAHHALYRLGRRDPETLERLAEAIEDYHPEEFQHVVDAIEAEPTVRKTIEGAGLTVREFYLTQYTLVSAVAVSDARARGRSDHLPEVSAANLEFVSRHAPVVRQVMTGRRPRDP